MKKKISRAFDAACMVSDREAELFRSAIPDVAVTVLPNGVDCDYFGAMPWSLPADPCLTFVGVMDYEPNVEAAIFFATEIWPSLRKRFPRAQFQLVGSRPHRQVLALANIEGVNVTGFVPDVRPYLAASTLVVAPLKIARGVQNKILEAMAARVPVLTTPEAAAGLAPEGRESLFIADRNPETFLSRLIETLENPQSMREKSAAARLFVEQNASWEKTGEILASLLSGEKAPG